MVILWRRGIEALYHMQVMVWRSNAVLIARLQNRELTRVIFGSC
jgi:hypothetical protein